jgi:hypothetical protein
MSMILPLWITGCGDSPATPPEPTPTKLAFIVQPTNITVREPITPAVRVAVRDLQDNTVTGAAHTITLRISAGTGPVGAALLGDVSGAAVDGVATFDDLTIDKPDSRYTLTATTTGLADASSTTFDVVPPPNPALIRLESDPGDWVGAGRAYQYTHTDAIITVTNIGRFLSLSIEGTEWWLGRFDGPDSLSQLTPGMYANVTRYPFHDRAVGGLDWGGESRGCNTLTGWFAVDSVVYLDGTLDFIDLRFEQHCEGLAPALHGTIHWERG